MHTCAMDMSQTVREQEAECTPAWAITDDSDALVLEIYSKCHRHCTAMRTGKTGHLRPAAWRAWLHTTISNLHSSKATGVPVRCDCYQAVQALKTQGKLYIEHDVSGMQERNEEGWRKDGAHSC